MPYSAFSGFDHIASGSLPQVYEACRHDPAALIFDQETGRVVDIDPRFPPSDEAVRPGRPKLGVTAREVTLLPRHWDWLATQPGGASVALRKLVEEASRNPKAQQRARRDRRGPDRFKRLRAEGGAEHQRGDDSPRHERRGHRDPRECPRPRGAVAGVRLAVCQPAATDVWRERDSTAAPRARC